MKTDLYKFLSPFIVLLLLTTCKPAQIPEFNGKQALDYAEELISFGNRTPGSIAISNTSVYIQEELSQFNWQVEFQDFTYKDTPLRNIIARKSQTTPDVIIGTHYDTRLYSDQEENAAMKALPVPGANDGTSGTAVLMELARALRNEELNIWLVFFDGEDQGHINDWDWSVGAEYFAANLQPSTVKVIIIDMVGDQDLTIYRETQSDTTLADEIWKIAQASGFEGNFIDQEKYTMIDDHLPFIQREIPACLLIDFDYPYWHTQSDTIDKISKESLYAVGHVLIQWLFSK
jgi:glutaminyl-peptide cyclotransferase